MNDLEWRYLLAGPTGDIKVLPNPTTWIAENTWPNMYRQIYGTSRLEAFHGFDTFFVENTELFKPIYDSSNPHE